MTRRNEKPVYGLPKYPGDKLATEAESWLNYHVTDPMTARDWKYTWHVRDMFALHFGFAIITHDLVEWVGGHEMFGPDATFIGVGSGTGYFEHELMERGYDAIVTDPASWHESYGSSKIDYFSDMEVRRMDHRGALGLLAQTPGSVMLLSWPAYEERWTEEVVREYEGRHLIYIGEGNSGAPGCTGSLGMLEALETEYREVDYYMGPTFARISDNLRVYERRSVDVWQR